MTHKTWELITLLGDMLVWSLANARNRKCRGLLRSADTRRHDIQNDI